jgi:hypothetical protein
VDAWRRHSWYHRLRHLTTTLDDLVPAGAPLLLIDAGQTGIAPSPARPIVPFPSREGVWWGAPADDEEALAELERHRREGIRHLAIVWTADWYLEQYPRFACHLRRHWRVLSSDQLVTVFELGR